MRRHYHPSILNVEDHLPAIGKHSQAKLSPSERVTIGILFAIKGGHFRPFYRFLKRDFSSLFGGKTHRSRLLRLLKAHRAWCDTLLAFPSFFTVIDTYPIELLFPIREGRSDQQVGKKGKDKGRLLIASSARCSMSKALSWLGRGTQLTPQTRTFIR